mmetsp:Transcript_8512/g.34828  ORF Transcript_8512/g.34828 Transcript_8512/m.34828 type:complete len:304 (+) Transcript_8512:490-1401(+)
MPMTLAYTSTVNRPGYRSIEFTSESATVALNNPRDSTAMSRIESRNSSSPFPAATSAGLATVSHQTPLCAIAYGRHASTRHRSASSSVLAGSISEECGVPDGVPEAAASRLVRLFSAACAVSRRTLAASGKMSFVSLAWLTKAAAAKPRSPPHGPTQRCLSCLDHAFDAHASEQYRFRSHPPWHSKHSGRGKSRELGKVRAPCRSSSSTRRSTTPSHASLCESRSSRVAIWRSIDPTYLKHCAHTVASSRLLSCWMPTNGGSHRTRSPSAKSRAANNPRPWYLDDGLTRTSPWPGRPGARREA